MYPNRTTRPVGEPDKKVGTKCISNEQSLVKDKQAHCRQRQVKNIINLVVVTLITSTFRDREYPIQVEIASNSIIANRQQQEKKSDNINIRFK